MLAVASPILKRQRRIRVAQADGPNQVMEAAKAAAGGSMNMRRLNFQSTLGGEVLTVDQVKNRPRNGRLDEVYSVRVKPEEGVNESTCAPDYSTSFWTILDHFSRVSQLCPTPHALYAVFYLVPMLIGW